MLKLDQTTRKLQAVLSGAVTTNQLPCMVSYSDDNGTTYVGGTQLTNTNSTTAVDICAAPGASTVRDIDYLSIRNRDTAAATVTVMLDDNGTDYEIVKAALAVGDQLTYTHGDGWRVIDADGNLKTGGSSGTGDVVGPASATANSLARFDGTTGKLLKNGAVIGVDVQAYDANLSNVREVLTGNRTYYVRTDGSDSNTGLVDSAGGAFLTLQKAYDTIVGTLDLKGYTVTVDVGNGTYTSTLACASGWTGGGDVTFTGDTTTPSNVVLSQSAASTDCISVTGNLPGDLTFTGFKFTTTGSGRYCVRHVGWGTVILGANEYGASVSFHIVSGAAGSVIRMPTAYTITGSAPIHIIANAGGYLSFSAACTLTGTPAFSAAFAYALRTGLLEVSSGFSFTGSATGSRYYADNNGVILLSGATFPGNSAGTTATGGQVN